jgi:hypothetical protein
LGTFAVSELFSLLLLKNNSRFWYAKRSSVDRSKKFSAFIRIEDFVTTILI